MFFQNGEILICRAEIIMDRSIKKPLLGEGKYTPLYPGDADFGKDVT